MRKTVSIVTVPLGKKGWNKGDLIDMVSLDYGLALYDNKEGIDDWKAVQLLVLIEFSTIASYPQTERALPISKETIQKWIDAGYPPSGVVTEYKYYNSKSYAIYDQPDETLIIEFGDGQQKNKAEEVLKPTIPTDDKIELMARGYFKFDEPISFIEAYIDGYKQALRDLGHIK